MKIKELMTRNVECLDPRSSLIRAARLMSEANVGSLPVVERGHVIGVLTDRDIVVRTVAAGINPVDSTVGEAMTPEVVHCHEEDDVEDAAELMAAYHIRRVVVTNEQGGVTGIVALADLATGAAAGAGAVLQEVSQRPQAPSEYRAEFAACEGAALLRGELAAVETYRMAIGKFGAGEAGAELKRLADEHLDAVRLLRQRMVDLDLDPPDGAGLWGAFAEAVEGAAQLLGPAAAIEALREGEERGIRGYRRALDDERLTLETKALIRDALLPRTWSRVSALETLLHAGIAA